MAANTKRSAKNLNNSSTSTPMKPATKQAKVDNEDSEMDISDFKEILLSVHEKLKKLDKLDAIERRLDVMDTDIRDIKHSLDYQYESMEDMRHSQTNVDNRLKDIEDKFEDVLKIKTKLEAEIVDVKARSMRNNLLFFNVPEKPEENPIEVVHNFLENYLKIEDSAHSIEIDRAHRLGAFRRGSSQPRPLVAKFLKYQDKEMARKNAHQLKGTSFAISEQFPKEINEVRKKLYPIFKKAKQEGKKAVLSKDKLYISGQLYRP